jgi:hypothetical protein
MRQVAIANMLPYRGERGAERPTRVWDLPVELQSDWEGDADMAVVEGGSVSGGGTRGGRGQVQDSMGELSSGWTDQLEEEGSSGGV